MQKRKNKSNMSKKSRLVIVGSLVFLLGAFMYIGKMWSDYNQVSQDKKKVDEFMNGQDETEIVEIDGEGNFFEEVKNDYDYVGVLEIPSIDFMKGFHEYGNINNHVDKNLEVIEPSDMPNVVNSNLIIAAHSGTGSKAFFKNLHKVKVDDLVNVYYEGVIYVYKVVDIYEVDKTGEVEINRNGNNTTLTLITCKPKDDTKQIVVICELIDEVIG